MIATRLVILVVVILSAALNSRADDTSIIEKIQQRSTEYRALITLSQTPGLLSEHRTTLLGVQEQAPEFKTLGEGSEDLFLFSLRFQSPSPPRIDGDEAQQLTQAFLSTSRNVAMLPLHASDVQSEQTKNLSLDTLSSSEFSYAGHVRYIIDGSAPLRNNQLRPWTLATAGAVYAGMVWGLHVYQKQTLWNQRSERFHVAEDGDYAQWVDKLGHFYGGYLSAYLGAEVLQGAGVSYEPARIWGTLAGILYMGYIETEDGFATGWSFSPSDMYCNVAGATYHLLQSYIPVLQNFSPKWIYMPSNLIGERRRTVDYHTGKEADNFNDDYSSSTFILSAKVYNLLPDNMKSYWVPWLNIGLGYATRNLGWVDPNNYLQDRKYIITLDYDLVELLPDFRQSVGGTFGDVLNWLKQSLNYFKLPSPALEIGEHGITRFNLLYPFKISLGGLKF